MFAGKNLQKWKPIRWKRLSFPSYESTTPTPKLKAFVSKTKGLEMFKWSKSGTVVKEIMGNETLIKVGKSKKTFDISNKSWSNLIKNGLNFAGIHASAIFWNNITLEFDFRLMEFTLFQFGIKSNPLKLLKTKRTWPSWSSMFFEKMTMSSM